ncbi:putative large terminase subunit domain protein [Escherichia coli DEC6B]|nr:putative large terminase subunit domain protein [Escherichia coli DEC6B]
MILKSRQIGATWYFAQEALLMALRDDVAQPYQRNQIFFVCVASSGVPV